MLELMIALSVTALIGAATVGMLSAVSTSIDTRHDSRTATIRSHHAQSRLDAYIAPSRCVLHHDNNAVVLWLDDARRGETVHISEVRWLIYSSEHGTISVYYVTFPSSMIDQQLSVHDQQYPASSDWMVLFNTYQSHLQATMNSITLIDGLTEVTTYLDSGNDALDARQVTFHLTFESHTGAFETIASSAIRRHRQPKL